MARKSNTSTTQMDKTSYFFTFQCGICHPGGGPTQYDRNGKPYYDSVTAQFGFGNGVTALPPEAKLDGDYGFIIPKDGPSGTAGTPVLANGWKKNGVLEPDCLLCHLQGYSWKNRAATLTAQGVATNTAGQPLAAFKVAPAVGAGWGTVTIAAAPAFPPTGTAVGPVDYEMGITAGTLQVDASNNLVIPLGKVGPTPEANCRGCHSTPDTKKSGRTLLDATDIHKANGIGCTGCHPSSADGEHQIGKGDAVIGSVRNDLDGTGLTCANCHLEGKAPLDLGKTPKDPTEAHRSIPSLHFASISCQACHIRYLEDDPQTAGMQVPELVIEMSTTGTQTISTWDKYFKTNPLDPSQDEAELAAKTSTYRWYPAIRSYKGKLTTVKPLLTAYYGDWIGGTGDGAIIRPIPLRLVRKALTGNYNQNVARLGTLPVTAGGLDGANPVPFLKEDIRKLLVAMRDAVDTANPDPAANNDIVVNPVLVRAEKIYFLNASGEVEWFESAVAESHDFSINHNVVPKRDASNPVLKPGPYGAGGCTDCHASGSSFFFGKQLAEPAQYEFVDSQGTVANPDAGKPRYVEHWEAMGLSQFRVASLTGEWTPVILRLFGAGPGSVVTGGGIECSFAGGSCDTVVGASPLTLLAAPGIGYAVKSWSGCTSVSVDRLTCTVDGGATGGLNGTKLVGVTFGVPDATPAPTVSGVVTTVVGTGWGTVTAPAISCSLGTQGACNAEVPNGTVVTLTATPGPNSWLSGWSGCAPVAGNANQCTVTIAGIMQVKATFSNGSGGGPYSETQRLIARVMGRAGNQIVGAGLSCGATTGVCGVDVPTGDTVTLTAVPAPGGSVVRWDGCTSNPTPTTCTVTLSAPRTVLAYFNP